MDVTKLAVDREKAKEYYEEYKAHRHYSTPIDDEIRAAYRAISKGKLVIQALESIKTSVGADGLPRLAIAGATAKVCRLERWADGRARMGWGPNRWTDSRYKKYHADLNGITFPVETFPLEGRSADRRTSYSAHAAQVPLIPIHLRPKQALEKYHILFEAEWEPIPPCDPYLLRRIGNADLWVVAAMWDLTPVERAALATRVQVQ